MVGMNDSGQRDRFLVDMKSGGVQVSMGTGYCGNNRKLGEVSYGRETWGSVSFPEHRIVGNLQHQSACQGQGTVPQQYAARVDGRPKLEL